MAIKGIAGAMPQASQVAQAMKKPAEVESSFGDFLKNCLDEVNKLQVEADQSIEDLATGKTSNVHETMIALEKADVSFHLMMQVRGKILDAYKEVIKIPV